MAIEALYFGYKVNRDGFISSKGKSATSPFLKPWKNKNGYLMVTLMIDGERKHKFLHHVVMEAFGNRKPSIKHQSRHLDGNKLNNKVSNLAWGTVMENLEDRRIHKTFQKGERHGMAKISRNEVEFIRASKIPNKILARQFKMTPENISSIKLRKTWK